MAKTAPTTRAAANFSYFRKMLKTQLRTTWHALVGWKAHRFWKDHIRMRACQLQSVTSKSVVHKDQHPADDVTIESAKYS